MKVIMINGSPNAKGNTFSVLNEMGKIFKEAGVEYEIINIGNLAIRGCLNCEYCKGHGKCSIDDIVNETALKIDGANGVVIGSPVYYASANGTLISFLDRLFHSMRCDLRMKVGASVVVARRNGITATFDELNKYFTISEMPIVSSSYWNGAFGTKPRDSLNDKEGMSIMRELANNMVFLMRSIELGKERYGLPEKIKKVKMDFIRED